MSHTPTVWITGDTISAALANNWEAQAAHLAADTTAIQWTRHAVRAYRSAALTLSAATETDLSFDAETYDTNGFHDLVTNPNRLTIPDIGSAGWWLWTCWAKFAAPATGYNHKLRMYIGTTLVDLAEASYRASASSRNLSLCAGHVVKMASGDYAKWTVECDQAIGLAVGTTETFAFGIKIAP